MTKRFSVFVWIVLANLVTSCLNLAVLTTLAFVIWSERGLPMVQANTSVPTEEVVTATATATATEVPTGEVRLTQTLAATAEWLGVDPEDVFVTGVSLQSTYVDPTGYEWPPKNEEEDQLLVVHLAFSEDTTAEEIGTWFEDGGIHAPLVTDGEGRVHKLQLAFPEDGTEGRKGMVLVFVVKKNADQFTLSVPKDKIEIDLSSVPVSTSTPTP